MLWTEDINQLFKPVLIPTDHMSIEDKLNAITRFIIMVGTIVTLISRDTRILLLMIILVLMIPLIYSFQNKYQQQADTFLNQKKLGVVNKEICVKPTLNNPFMNPSVFEMNDNHGSCPIYDEKIEDEVDKLFASNVFKNADDIYDRENSKRQFYSVPGKRIPNDQTKFANWLYKTPPTCKENNGEMCYNKVYKDLRI